jgi:hypothetical protein
LAPATRQQKSLGQGREDQGHDGDVEDADGDGQHGGLAVLNSPSIKQDRRQPVGSPKGRL